MKTKKEALEILHQDAQKIKNLITSKKNALCIAQCKAFEEVLDTQMYGFSREVFYAKQLGVLSDCQAQEILAELEKELNVFYSKVYADYEKGGEKVATTKN